MTLASIQFLLERSRPGEAEAAAREALARDPDDPALLLFLGIALLHQDKPKAAEEVFRQVIALEPGDDSARFWLARALNGRSRHREALAAIDSALELVPRDAESHGLRAAILIDLGRREQALEAAGCGLEIDPDNESCRFLKGVVLGQKGRHEEADDLVSGMLADDPDSAATHSARGWTLHLRGDGDGAERHFIEALRIEPGYEDARIGLVESLKLRHPLSGGFMRFLLWLGRFPWYAILLGVIVVMQLGKFAARSEHFAIALAGTTVRSGLFFLFMLLLVREPVLNLTLATTRKGRLALSTEQKKSLWFLTPPMLAGLVFFILWVTGGGRSLPVHSIAWFGVAALGGEVIESTRPPVRRAMAWVTATALALATYLLAMDFAHVAPRMDSLLADLPEASTDEQALAELAGRLKSLVQQRIHLLHYPALAILFAAAFRDNLREFFERRAADPE